MCGFISFWPEKKQTTVHNKTEKRICREIKRNAALYYYKVQHLLL